MAPSRKRRATPGVPPSPVPSPARTGPRLAVGGGRGPGEPMPAAARSGEIWLALHLPDYVLESLRARDGAAVSGERAGPTAVVDRDEAGRVIRACDAAAMAAGIAPGMSMNSALALCPDLRLQARDAGAERALLERVARLAADFTPRVALEQPDGVLLEVRGSLRLFGGVRALIARLRASLCSAGVGVRIALAPTPLGALWFARAGVEVALRGWEGLPGRLAPLSIACARWPEQSVELLGTMGVRTLGDCLRLPREGLARRLGPALLRTLDRATGRAADPRTRFVPREQFVTRRDLEPEIADTGGLGGAIEPLLGELCGALQARGQGVSAIELRFIHRDLPATRLRLRFAEPVSRVERMSGLLGERLARTDLPAPVRAVRLRSGPPLQVHEATAEIFVRERRNAAGALQLVERLRARLGESAVHGLCVVPEHRPEKNGDILLFSHAPPAPRQAAARKKGECPHFFRPLWLLAEPEPLDGGEAPHYEGRLEIEEGPERIESGWWDGGDVRRDYYVARTPAGVRVWVFRERRPAGRWFLHGVFG
jgi:protein ImuB